MSDASASRKRFSHISDIQVELLDKKLQSRSDKKTLVNKNILKEASSDRIATAQEALLKHQQKTKLSRLLANRETMEDIRKRNIMLALNSSPAIQQQQADLRLNMTKNALKQFLTKRPSRETLISGNVLRGDPTRVAAHLHSAQMTLARKREQNQLRQKLADRPRHEDLVKMSILKGDAAIHTQDDHEAALCEVFRFYCTSGDASNTELMGHAKWYKFIRDCRVLDNGFTYADVDILLQEVLSATTAGKIGYEQFRRAVALLAVRVYPAEVTPDVSLQKLFLCNILPYASRTAPDTIADLLLDPQVLMVFDAHRKALRQLFSFLAGQRVELKTGAAHGSERGEDVRRANNTISLKQFQVMARKFGLFPELVTKAELDRAFVCSSLVNSASDELTYPEFLEALGRVALLALSKPPYDELYPSVREKVETLLVRHTFMNIEDGKHVAEKLKNERSFC